VVIAVDVLYASCSGDALGVVGKWPVGLQRIAAPVISVDHTRDNGCGSLGLRAGNRLAQVPTKGVNDLYGACRSRDGNGFLACSR
jgi:hypothetical protein